MIVIIPFSKTMKTRKRKLKSPTLHGSPMTQLKLLGSNHTQRAKYMGNMMALDSFRIYGLWKILLLSMKLKLRNFEKTISYQETPALFS